MMFSSFVGSSLSEQGIPKALLQAGYPRCFVLQSIAFYKMFSPSPFLPSHREAPFESSLHERTGRMCSGLTRSALPVSHQTAYRPVVASGTQFPALQLFYLKIRNKKSVNFTQISKT